MFRKTITGLLAASLILAPCSVSGSTITASAATKPTATKSLTLTVGEEGRIKVKGNNIKSYKFKVVDKKIASVSQKGVVKAKKQGKCNVKITVKYRKTKKAKKLFTKKLTCHVTVKKADKPKNTKKTKTTKAPQQTVTPQTTKTPEITVTPKPTAAPDVPNFPAATITPEIEITAAPEVTATPELTATPVPTATPEPTAILQPTVAPVVTVAPETPTVTTAPTPGPTTISDVAEINIQNSSWEMACVNLAVPITFHPGEKVFVSASAKDANGNSVTDFYAHVIFSSVKDGQIWENQINVCSGQNPAYADEWRWVSSYNSPVQLFNTLTDAATANGIIIQVATPSSSLSNTDMITFTIDTIKIETATQKNSEDVAALTKIIEEQNASGAHASTDLDSAQYVWGEDGQLEMIYWNGCGLSGDLSLSGLSALSLIDCSENQLTGVDVSQNAALTHLSCYGNKLTSLNVKNNPSLGLLRCDDNQLTDLDVSKNPYLSILNCMSNQLSSLDVSKNEGLTYFYCDANKLTEIDISKQTKLLHFSCSANEITSLDISNNPALSTVRCTSNQITSIDATHNPALSVLDCDKGVSVTGFTKKRNEEDVAALNKIIEEQTASGATISADLDSEQYVWDENGRLQRIYWGSCNLSGELSLASLTALTDVWVGAMYITSSQESNDRKQNQLTSLDVSKNTALMFLYCDDNQLTNLDVSKNTALKHLECRNNQLTNLDVSKNTALLDLYCRNNQLINLDVSKNTVLKYLNCSNNQLTVLDVTHNAGLEELWCDNNQLINLDVSLHPNLLQLSCDENVVVQSSPKNTKEVAALNQIIEKQNEAGASMPVNLENSAYIWAPNGHLREIHWDRLGLSGEISLSEFTYLDSVTCDDNAISGIDVSKNTSLTVLYCSGNQLTDLDVSQNTGLWLLICTGNPLTNLDVSNCFPGIILECDSDVEVIR